MALDTPVFELRETLMGKYGEDSKLIYDLADQVFAPLICSLYVDFFQWLEKIMYMYLLLTAFQFVHS